MNSIFIDTMGVLKPVSSAWATYLPYIRTSTGIVNVYTINQQNGNAAHTTAPFLRSKHIVEIF